MEIKRINNSTQFEKLNNRDGDKEGKDRDQLASNDELTGAGERNSDPQL